MTPDYAKICRVGNQSWLNHDWSVAGVCKRCGAVLPKREVRK